MSHTFQVSRFYNREEGRHYINGVPYVFHCHHYTALITQLAIDARVLEGIDLLKEAAEETFYPLLTVYFKEKHVSDLNQRQAMIEDYFSFMALGKLKLTVKGEQGEAVMTASNVDESWLRKLGQRDQPVNFIGQGFLQAAFAALFDKKINSYQATETTSLVAGAPESVFKIKPRKK